MIVESKSGMGKTLIYILGILNQIEVVSTNLLCVIISPTRELAFQIFKEFNKFGKYFPEIQWRIVMGGLSLKKQETSILNSKPQIIIGTPGRLMELENQHVINFNEIKFLVFDECDKILSDLGLM